MLKSKKIFKLAGYGLIIGMLGLTGCAKMHTSNTASTDSNNATATASSANEPYFPTNFNDFEVPGELKLDSKHTMFINTTSFKGGIVAFDGRVEKTSLADFFINSMQKNNWRLTGEIRYDSILLSFTKPNKNCMISIYDDPYGYKTKVNVYMTENSNIEGGQ